VSKKEMTYLEFLAALRKTPRKWGFYKTAWSPRTIRLGNDRNHCPIIVVYENLKEKKFSTVSWRRAGEIIGLPESLTDKIGDIADNSHERNRDSRVIRLDLLKATGLWKKRKKMSK